MSNWEHVYSYHDEYILQKRWNRNKAIYEFRIERNLLNLPPVDIVHLRSNFSDLTESQKTLIGLGYSYQFVVGDINSNVAYPDSSLDALKQNIFYLMKAQDALVSFQYEVARTMNIWID